MGASATDSGLLTFANGSSGRRATGLDRPQLESRLGVAVDNLQNLAVCPPFAKGRPRRPQDRLPASTTFGRSILHEASAPGSPSDRPRIPIRSGRPMANGSPIAPCARDRAAHLPQARRRRAEPKKCWSPTRVAICSIPSDWSSDGKTLFYSNGFHTGERTTWALRSTETENLSQMLTHAVNATLSPNGRWLAYTVFSGQAEVYVMAYGGGQGKWQVSPNGGQVPHWSKDGKELYYLDGTQSIVAVPVKDLGNTLEFGAGQTLVSQWTVLSIPFYSVFPDGQKLLMERVSQQVSQPITVVTNFTAQLRK